MSEETVESNLGCDEVNSSDSIGEVISIGLAPANPDGKPVQGSGELIMGKREIYPAEGISADRFLDLMGEPMRGIVSRIRAEATTAHVNCLQKLSLTGP